jgi:hypothetical protein
MKLTQPALIVAGGIGHGSTTSMVAADCAQSSNEAANELTVIQK